jgi:hypothetical protein
MEKWDSLSRSNGRRRYVVPNCILEEELAQAKAAADKKNDNDRASVQRSRSNSLASLHEEEPVVEPEELLRRARSRLLEDLSEGSITGEKGQLTLPHALSKYKHVSEKCVDILQFASFGLALTIGVTTGVQQKWSHWYIHSF